MLEVAVVEPDRVERVVLLLAVAVLVVLIVGQTELLELQTLAVEVAAAELLVELVALVL